MQEVKHHIDYSNRPGLRQNYDVQPGASRTNHALPPKESLTQLQKQHKKSYRKLVIISICILVSLLIAGCTGAWLYTHKNQSPLPKGIMQSVDFPLYYPSSIPAGYKLSRASIKYDNGIVFYTLSRSNNNIQISEQNAPPNPPDFSAIQKAYSSFKKVDIPAGQAINGDYRGTPTAIMLTNTTLINISASKDTPQDVLVRLVQDLQSLPN